MRVQLRVEEADERIDEGELGAHAGLRVHEVALHAAHEGGEGPEGQGVVLGHGVERGEEVGHALDVAEGVWGVVGGVWVRGGRGVIVFEVGEEHVFELFEVYVGAGAIGIVEGGGGVRVGNVFAGEEGDVAVGAVDVFFWNVLGMGSEGKGSVERIRTDSALLLAPPFFLLGSGIAFDHTLPPRPFQPDVFISFGVDMTGSLSSSAVPIMHSQ